MTYQFSASARERLRTREDGGERGLPTHIGVRGGHEVGFARCMFVYHYRLFNRYNRTDL